MDIQQSFNTLFPFSLISNVILYRNDRRQTDLFANEIDYLFHYKIGEQNHLVIVEQKKQKVYGNTQDTPPTANSPWKLSYNEKVKDIKQQVRNQTIALKQFCNNVTQTRPEIESWIVDPRQNTQDIIVDEQDKTLNLLTFSGYKYKLEQINSFGSVIRVEHSEFLRELRKGVIAPEVGHPEIPSGIRFIEICRKSLDDQIYRVFQPRANRYAINGCAGMGKSVLLAYGIYVFASDYAIEFDNSEPRLTPYTGKAKFPPRSKRKIYVYAVKQKQLEILKKYWNDIQKYISSINPESSPALQKPVFRHWTGDIHKDCNILIIDEAHDLSLSNQKTVANWLKDDNPQSPQKYLLIACDRNQSLKRKYSDEDIIDGINFSGHSTRLNRVYRCPFPVYAASIGLLFRWFASQGGSIVLSNKKLREHFAFKADVIEEKENSMILSMRNDSHPGNNWNQTVSYFNNCATAYGHLSQFPLRREDVLWARFEKIEKEFDYDLIQRNFTFVDLQGEGADNEIDRNIKGQEFAVVIVEGLPAGLNPIQLKKKENWGDNISEIENKMWKCRRDVYVTCSRASAFLYFISDIDNSKDENAGELRNLIKQVTQSERGKNESGQTWTFKVNKPAIKRKPIVFIGVEGDDTNRFKDSLTSVDCDKKKDKSEPAKIIKKSIKKARVESSPIPNIRAIDENKIRSMPFDSNKFRRLRQIYGVLYFMKNGFDYPEALKETLKLFPEVKDVQTIADKCARNFAGNTETFKEWYDSGELLDRLYQILNLSGNDYNIFKNLLQRLTDQKSFDEKIHHTAVTTPDVIKRKAKKYKTHKKAKKIVNPNEIVLFENTKYRWDGSQWLNAEDHTTLPGNTIQQLNREFVTVKKI